MIAEAANHSL